MYEHIRGQAYNIRPLVFIITLTLSPATVAWAAIFKNADFS